jgi:hypothetical protein
MTDYYGVSLKNYIIKNFIMNIIEKIKGIKKWED